MEVLQELMEGLVGYKGKPLPLLSTVTSVLEEEFVDEIHHLLGSSLVLGLHLT